MTGVGRFLFFNDLLINVDEITVATSEQGVTRVFTSTNAESDDLGFKVNMPLAEFVKLVSNFATVLDITAGDTK